MSEGDAGRLLNEKVKEWFDSEGYPLEFRVAQAFEEQGFVSHQGHYVTNEEEEQAREIDILANMDADLTGGGYLRVSHVIECKWSRDKPWVVFTSPRSIMAESACIAQTAGSVLGEAVMYCLAGDAALYPLEIFKDPERGGFSGRRAFERQEKDKYDQFYRTVQSVVSASRAEAKSYDNPAHRLGEAPHEGAVVFPLIAVDGQLFEAYYDPHGDAVKVSEVDRIRLFWRGARPSAQTITPVDIVTAKAIAAFARTRASEVNTLMEAAEQASRRIQRAFSKRSFEELQIAPAPRGFVGLPPLLRDLYSLTQRGRARSRSRG
jgi:hypothetical protein